MMTQQWIRILGVLLGVFSLSCTNEALPENGQRVRELRDLNAASDRFENLYLNSDRVVLMEQGLRQLTPQTLGPYLKLQSFLPTELLQAGFPKRALVALERFKESLKQYDPEALKLYEGDMEMMKAVCFMRQAELDNCLLHHSSESCVFPISGMGIHQLPENSLRASELLKEILEKDPNKMAARWLYNLSEMTLGRYPESVPAAWRIPSDPFGGAEEFPRFNEIGASVGLNVYGHAGGSIADDFNNDGLLDLVVTSWTLEDPMKFFVNQGDGTFRDATVEAGLGGYTGGLNLVQADFNNDGFMDFFVMRGAWLRRQGRHPNSLFQNNGDGTFTDETKQAGVLSYFPTQTAVWFDFNLDGWVDLFIGNETSSDQESPCELYQNQGDGTFTEVAKQVGLDVRKYVKGVTAGDYDNDGLPDLYLSILDEPNLLMKNMGYRPSERGTLEWTFQDRAEVAGVREPSESFPTWFWDYDNDGWLDLFVAGYKVKDVGDLALEYLGQEHGAATARLYRNQRDGTFEDVSEAVGLKRILYAMGSNYGDLDNDGFLDFYIGTGAPDTSVLVPNLMFKNESGKRFRDVTVRGGFGHLQKGHGVSFADFDNDGDQDIYSVIGGAYSGDVYWNVLFENPIHHHYWMKVKLVGVKANRAGVGARLKWVCGEGDQEMNYYSTLSSGGSFGSNPLIHEMGLGGHSTVRRLEILWPGDSEPQILTNLEANRGYAITQGKPEMEELELPQFTWKSGDVKHQHYPAN